MSPMACLKKKNIPAHTEMAFYPKTLTPPNFFSHIQEENRGKMTEDSFLIPCLKQKKEVA